jgi:hypothetical protein
LTIFNSAIYKLLLIESCGKELQSSLRLMFLNKYWRFCIYMPKLGLRILFSITVTITKKMSDHARSRSRSRRRKQFLIKHDHAWSWSWNRRSRRPLLVLQLGSIVKVSLLLFLTHRWYFKPECFKVEKHTF